MTVPKLAAAVLLTLTARAADMPLPVLRIEPTAGGSIFYVKNTSTQPLTAFLIELVDYPGSSYSLWRDVVGEQPVGPGAEMRIPVTNMTVGAVPDYVKLRAAVFADGSSSGIPEKVRQLVERRRATLKTTRELVSRLGKPGAAKPDLIAGLNEWSTSLQPVGKPKRETQESINQTAARNLIESTVRRLGVSTVAQTLEGLRGFERALAASKPTL